MTKLTPSLIAFVAALTISAPALALTPNMSLPSDERIKLLMYDESDVYTITTRYGYQSNIVFSPTEEIQTISVGDRSLWQITPSGFRLFIRPMQSGVVTNMTVITNKHSYQFDLKSVGDNEPILTKEECEKAASSKKARKACSETTDTGDVAGVIYVAKFVYPEDMPTPAGIAPSAPVSLIPAHMEPPPPAMPAPPEHAAAPALPGYTNYNYTYGGPDEIAPVQIYDNGTVTFAKFKSMPASISVYAVDAGGNTTTVPFSTKDDMLIIDYVGAEMAVKSDAGTVNIYNEMLTPK